jgi:hypothetical protein
LARTSRRLKLARARVKGQVMPSRSIQINSLTNCLMSIPPTESTTQAAKSVEISTSAGATGIPAREDTYVPDVVARTQSFGVIGVHQIRLQTHNLLHREAWARHLMFHPDKDFSFRLLRYLDEGVPILYEGPNYDRVCPNWRSVDVFRKAVEKTLVEDVKLGRKSGPFPYPPLMNFVSSSLGAFEKKRSGKMRVIHDLSWPPSCSVNSHIDPALCSVSYVSIDDAVKALKFRGCHALMSKLDLKDAYKNIVVRPEDWHHLGSSIINASGATDFYVDHVLPFGLRSSALLFD